MPTQRREPEAQFTPATQRRPASSRRESADEDEDVPRRRRSRKTLDEPTSKAGLWIGLAVGIVVLGLGAIVVVAGFVLRPSTTAPIAVEAPPQVAVVEKPAFVPPANLVPAKVVPVAKVEPPKIPEAPAAKPNPVPVPVVPPVPVAPPAAAVADLPARLGANDIPRVKKATAFLRVTAFDGEKMTGSGFFAIEPGLVFTNAHVVDMLAPDSQAPKSIEIVLNSGEPDEKVLQGKIVGVDRDHDLAIVKASGGPGDWPALLAVDFAANCTELQDVYVFGFPFGANLGKNISVSKSSISSLRKDELGQLREVQVNGGMNPGNSGGPVVDSRGVVVGVAVAIIRGTQINFAVPAERVLELAAGRVRESHLLDPYKAGNDIRLPFEVACLDPLQHIRKVEVEVWTGSAGPNRGGGTKTPVPVPGDGPRSRTPMTYAAGKAVADLTLPTAKAGTVVWVQPILSDANGKSSWGTARSASLDDMAPLTRQPATIRIDFAKVPERTLVLKNQIRLEIKKRDIGSETLEANLLEQAKTVGDGAQTELWIGSLKRVIDVDGKQRLADPLTVNRLKTHPLGWSFFPEGRSKARRSFVPNGKMPPAVREEMEDLINAACSGIESTFVSAPPGEMQPGGTWPARVPMMFTTQGKTEVADLQLTCTYEGTRMSGGNSLAFARAIGQIVPRKAKDSSFLRGKVDGRIHFDARNGYIADAKMRITSEMALTTGSVANLIIETDLKRTPGNTFNIVPLKK
jgi:S1-C subfamily serine protease